MSAHTPPSPLAARVSRCLAAGIRLRVTNLGVPGHTFTQELIELLLQLRSGPREAWLLQRADGGEFVTRMRDVHGAVRLLLRATGSQGTASSTRQRCTTATPGTCSRIGSGTPMNARILLSLPGFCRRLSQIVASASTDRE